MGQSVIGTLGHSLMWRKMTKGEITGQSVTNGLGIWLRLKRTSTEEAKTNGTGGEMCEFICRMGMKK